MSKEKIPNSPGIRFLKNLKTDFEVFQYKYEEKGGTAQTSEKLLVDEHLVIKTLVLENESKYCIIILQHGDKNVSTKKLARFAGFKKLEPADAKTAFKWTGYQFGGTSPFGTKRDITIYAEETIFELERIYINGGGKGLIVALSPAILEENFDIKKVSVIQ